MILMLSPWHTLMIVAVFLSLSAFLLAVGILWLLSRAYNAAKTDATLDAMESQAKREKRSAAAKQGHATRRARRAVELVELEPAGTERYGAAPIDAETERVLRAIDAQAKARGE